MSLSTIAVNIRWDNRLRFCATMDSVASKLMVFSLQLCLGMLCVCGCGTGPKASNPASQIDSREAPKTETTTGSEANSASEVGEKPTAQADERGPAPTTASSLSPEANAVPAIAPPADPEVSGGAGLADSPANDVEAVAQPSAEQLARWTSPDFETLQLLGCLESSEAGLVSHLAQAKDGRHYITAGTKVVLWSLESETPVHVFWEGSGEQSVKSLAVSPNGKWFAVGDSDGMLRMWSVADHKELNTKQLYANDSDIVQIAISPDGQEICTISYDDEIRLWSAQQLEQKNRFKVDTDSLKQIEYLTNDLLVAAGKTTSSWNVRTGKLEKVLSPGRYNFSLARSPDGKRFLFGEEEALSLIDVDEHEPKVTLTGGFASDEIAVFSGDSKHLATANSNSIRIWDLASGQLVQVIDAFGWPITGLNWLPNSNLVIASSLNGRVRLWGTKADGQNLGLQPLHAEIAMPSPDAREPATAVQLMNTMDLRTFPRLPGGLTSVVSDFSLTYECAESIDEAKLFYRYQFGKRGWREVPQAVAMPHLIRFQKEGFGLTASFYEGSKLKTMVMVSFGGNYDLRWIPKLDSAPIELVFENEDTVMYRTKAELVDIETTLLRKLSQAGWTAYSRLNSSHSEGEGSRQLTFLRGGMTLNVNIGRDPTDATKFNVQYGRSFSTKSLPVPPDSGYVEFDGSTQPMLVALTAMSLDDTRNFYDQKMVAEGWLVREFGRNVKEEGRNWLSYVRGQQDVTIGLERLASGKTRVTAGDNVQKSSWQLAQETLPVGNDAAITGLEAVDFPILNESKVAKYDAIAKSLEISMDETPLIKVGELYKQQLLSMGWTQEGAGIIEADYVFLTFIHDKAEIEVRARVDGGKSIVNVQGDGILWNKPLPGDKRIISYETWLRVNHHPATLDLLDKYQAEMR
jgi:WD40 repeat protein